MHYDNVPPFSQQEIAAASCCVDTNPEQQKDRPQTAICLTLAKHWRIKEKE